MNDEALRQKLLSIKQIANECLESLANPDEAPLSVAATPADSPGGVEDIGLAIANKVGECEEGQKLEKILSKPSPESKILLCLYIAYKYFDKQWLTTGDIVKATADLGVKIDQGNASNKIKSMRAYVESGSVRKKGQPTLYRLNRFGLTHFEEIMNA
ncbi:MAG: hypothetical protein KGQ68_05365 [Gammaproteobacteria bacterium]|nr:hypothetical protein [Gammaproteobacteria bacterium]